MTPDQKPETTGVDLDELDRAFANCDYDLIGDAWPDTARRLRELEAIACAATVLADAGPGRTSGPMWTLLWTFLNDRVRRSLVPAMQRQGLPYAEHNGEWRSEPAPSLPSTLSDLAGDTIRARAESAEARAWELEQCHRDDIDHIGKLQLESAEGWGKYRAEKAERREAESRITALESQLEAARSNAAQISDELVALGNELAAAREEQGLEARLVEALAARDAQHSLQLRKHGVESWMGVARDRDWKERVYEAETLPALLRAILECEVKGG